jgi:hypothetical protein
MSTPSTISVRVDGTRVEVPSGASIQASRSVVIEHCPRDMHLGGIEIKSSSASGSIRIGKIGGGCRIGNITNNVGSNNNTIR